ncbi:MAG TPA: hypothetical protein DIT13_19655 [Verrucomicrobiales bacterium]|nr:hypothetical protein [Verrucomicrobiales bacterium]HRJ09296.1 hypothetical protein [Prosthecobacter sp.]HRK15595.1 hypothetical protein [Prosthecobacter sp.]
MIPMTIGLLTAGALGALGMWLGWNMGRALGLEMLERAARTERQALALVELCRKLREQADLALAEAIVERARDDEGEEWKGGADRE